MEEAELTVQEIKPKNASEIEGEEAEKYLQVSGWRVWVPPSLWDVWASLDRADEYRAFEAALHKVEKNPLTLKISIENKKVEERKLFSDIAHRMGILTGGTGRRDGVTIMYLEPLTEEEVSKIDREGQAPGPANSIDRPDELVRPDDLRKIFKSKK